MRIGVVFPQTEIGSDSGAVKAYAEAVEALGYAHLVAFDHVLGAGTATRPNWSGPYTDQSLFHEPLVLFGYLAALTRRIELVTGIVILPQRQTALVAKQAAEVDVLSGGRLRLGVGIGWDVVEYVALGENFHNRGRRSEEQVEVLRALWAQEVVSYEGKWHKITDAGINPLPPKRSIPIWFGGGRTDQVLRRIARLGEGWFPQGTPDAQMGERLGQFREFVTEAGRDPSQVGIEGRARWSGGVEEAVGLAKSWEEIGATHLALNTMGASLTGPDQHIDAIRSFSEAIGKGAMA